MRLRTVSVVIATALIAASCSTQSAGTAQEPPQSLPVSTTAEVASQTNGTIPTVIVLDASGSMKQDDAPGLRIDAAKSAIHTLVDDIPDGTELGLIAYGTSTGSSDAEKAAGCGDIKTVVPLGPLDRPAFAAGIDGLTASGYTPIISALAQASTALPSEGDRTIILVSDGEDTCSPKPPCESIESIPNDPGLTIHAIGFKLDDAASGQLRCIADATGGMAIDAANAAQLTTRLAVASDPNSAQGRLSTKGFHDLHIGMTEQEARKVVDDLPTASGTGTVIVDWRDCDLTFTEGVLTEIAPRTGAMTLDGLTVGQTMKRAEELYGPFTPTTESNGNGTAVFPADTSSGTGYRITFVPDALKSVSGTITRIVLCRCLPGTGNESTGGAATEVVNLTPVDASGKPKSGWTVSTPTRKIDKCYSASQSAVTTGVVTCGITADGADACWVGATADSIVCMPYPWKSELFTAQVAGGIEDFPVASDPRPFGIELENGLRCRVRHGGSWSSPDSDPDLRGAYSCVGGTDTSAIVWTDFGVDTPDRSSNQWTVLVGPTKGPLETVAVTKAYFLAAE